MDRVFRNTRPTAGKGVVDFHPNRFFKKFLDTHQPGTILLLSGDTGGNALYAGYRGWAVDAPGFTETTWTNTGSFAEDASMDHNHFRNAPSLVVSKKYDAVGLIHVQVPAVVRQTLHRDVYQSLRSGGFLILEAFAKEQIQMNSGGPTNLSLLYDVSAICQDFPFLHVLYCGQKEIATEGKVQQDNSAVLQLIGQKL